MPHSTMTAICRRQGQAAIEQRATPLLSLERDVLVQVVRVGICRTDIQVLQGIRVADDGRIAGHECAGVVVATSNGSVTVGQRVAVFPALACGDCFDCGLGHGPWACTQSRFLGVDCDGAFAEYVAVPAANIRPIPDNVSWELAAYWEPVTAAWAIREVLEKQPKSHRVLVLGGGRIARLTQMVLEDHEDVDTHHHPEAQAYDVVVECRGDDDVIEQSLTALRPEGLLVLKSRPAGRVAFDLTPITQKRLRLVGAHYGNADDAWEWMVTRQELLESLFGPAMPLSEMDVAWEEDAREHKKLFFAPSGLS